MATNSPTDEARNEGINKAIGEAIDADINEAINEAAKESTSEGPGVGPSEEDSLHYRHLRLAMKHFLRLDIVESTLAQLYDGLPTCAVYVRDHGLPPPGLPPLTHENICPGCREQVRRMFDLFNFGYAHRLDVNSEVSSASAWLESSKS